MRIVDVEPLIKFFENGINDFRISGNGLGVRIYQNILNAIKTLPVIKKDSL